MQIIAQFCEFCRMPPLLQADSSVWLSPELRPSPNLYEDWMILVFFLSLTILAYVRVVYGKRIQRLYSSLLRVQILKQVMREELVFSHRASVLLFLNFCLVISLIGVAAAKFYGWNVFGTSGMVLYGVFFVTVSGAYLLKLLVASILRVVLADPGLLREYLYVVFLVNKAAGIILLPLALGLIYLNVGALQQIFFACIAVLLILGLYRIVQGALLSVGYRVPKVYIILYLCTLEIMPLLVIIGAMNREII